MKENDKENKDSNVYLLKITSFGSLTINKLRMKINKKGKRKTTKTTKFRKC